MDRLIEVEDASEVWKTTLAEFASTLVERYEALPPTSRKDGGISAFWGADPRWDAAKCTKAVYRIALPMDEPTQQILFIVESAAARGLMVVDDEDGTCFLPDGTVLPERNRISWESDLADLRAGPVDPTKPIKDSRNIWQKIAGELINAIGR